MAAPYESLSPSLGIRYNEHNQPVGKTLESWTGCARLPDTVLAGRYCQVVPFNISHIAPLFEAYSHDSNGMWTYMPFGPFMCADDLKDTVIDRIQNGGFQTFTIMSLMDKRPIGQSSYMRYDLANGSVEIGAVSFSPALKHSTIATEAMYLMMKHAFDHGYRRYEWKCDQLNIPSNKAALRLGFQYEGTFRNAVVNKGRRRDTCWYSIIVEDWPHVRARLEAWLDPANFEPDGTQKTALSSRA